MEKGISEEGVIVQKWEYLFIRADYVGGQWKPRHMNDQEVTDWKRGPVLSEFANQLGEQGWELVAAPFSITEGVASFRLIFKRPKV